MANEPDINNILTYGGGSALILVAIRFAAKIFSSFMSRTDANTAGSDAQTELIKTLMEERDTYLQRADEFAKERNRAFEEVSELKAKIDNLEQRLSQTLDLMNEREQHVELLVGLLDHLLFEKPLSPEMQHKLTLLRTLGTLTGELLRKQQYDWHRNGDRRASARGAANAKTKND
jgi:hypothetical protein